MFSKFLKKMIKPCKECGSTNIHIEYYTISKFFVCKCLNCNKASRALTPIGILYDWNRR